MNADTTAAPIRIETRSLENDLPAYTLRNYQLVWIAYNDFEQPMGTGKMELPNLPPGTVHTAEITWPTFKPLKKIYVEVFRPTGFSVLDAAWRNKD